MLKPKKLRQVLFAIFLLGNNTLFAVSLPKILPLMLISGHDAFISLPQISQPIKLPTKNLVVKDFSNSLKFSSSNRLLLAQSDSSSEESDRAISRNPKTIFEHIFSEDYVVGIVKIQVVENVLSLYIDDDYYYSISDAIFSDYFTDNFSFIHRDDLAHSEKHLNREELDMMHWHIVFDEHEILSKSEIERFLENFLQFFKNEDPIAECLHDYDNFLREENSRTGEPRKINKKRQGIIELIKRNFGGFSK